MDDVYKKIAINIVDMVEHNLNISKKKAAYKINSTQEKKVWICVLEEIRKRKF